MSRIGNNPIALPQGITFEINENVVTVKGKLGELSRKFESPKISFQIKDGELVFLANKPTKREKTLMLTFVAHIKNMFKGVEKTHKYQLKICSGHFPMSVSVSTDKFTVKNFLGEKVPRVLKLKQGGKVLLEGEIVTIESMDIELAGQIATDIEQLTRVTNRDRRIFQDGIYIIKKPRAFES